MKRLILFFSSFLSLTAIAQNKDSLFIKRLADEILLNSKAYDNLRVLTKQIGGRLAGSPQMVKAENWGATAMQTAGAERVELQECMVPHWVRGGADKATAFYGKEATKGLDIIALGNTVGTMKPLKAPVILINTFDELEQKKTEVKGKIVFKDNLFLYYIKKYHSKIFYGQGAENLNFT